MSEFCEHHVHESHYCGSCNNDLIKRLQAENKELLLKWQNVSMLCVRMNRKKCIEDAWHLFEKGKHLIYSNILREK